MKKHKTTIFLGFLRLIRWPNLLIVALTQFFLYYALLLPALRSVQLTPLLDDLHFALFVFVTIIITVGGNIINDIIDCEIDRLNRPEKLVVNNIISRNGSLQLYGWNILLGLLLSIYLAIYAGNSWLVSIYPLAVAGLHFYSTHFKRQVLIGNVIIALFCAGVAGIIWFAEREAMHKLQALDTVTYRRIQMIFLWYTTFAFLSTLYREIVKDLQDKGGDQTSCRTLPIVLGERTARMIGWIVGFLLFFFVVVMMVKEYPMFPLFAIVLMVGVVCIPLIYTLVRLMSASRREDYGHISQWIKGIMLGGLFVLLALILKN